MLQNVVRSAPVLVEYAVASLFWQKKGVPLGPRCSALYGNRSRTAISGASKGRSSPAQCGSVFSDAGCAAGRYFLISGENPQRPECRDQENPGGNLRSVFGPAYNRQPHSNRQFSPTSLANCAVNDVQRPFALQYWCRYPISSLATVWIHALWQMSGLETEVVSMVLIPLLWGTS